MLVDKPSLKIIEPKIPRFVVCPTCGRRQRFKKAKEHFKVVKDMSLDEPKALKVRMVYAKCLNPDCPRKAFSLPIPGIGRWARATDRLKSEAVNSIVLDNSTYPRASRRLSRSLNTTGSPATISRWKHEIASRYTFPYIINLLGFSGILCIDEYSPLRSDSYDLVASDGLKNYILYLDEAPERNAGHVQAFLRDFKGTLVEDILVLKEWIRNIFLTTLTQEDAYRKRELLYNAGWHLKNPHFRRIINFLMGPQFQYMVTYLAYPYIPKSGNSELLIRAWRQMEKVRYGFKTISGRQDHLKLYALAHYLGRPLT